MMLRVQRSEFGVERFFAAHRSPQTANPVLIRCTIFTIYENMNPAVSPSSSCSVQRAGPEL
jgi:hypothetical protein